VITIGRKPETGSSALENYLAWHGIDVRHALHMQEPVYGAAAHLIDHAQADGADLLVMGAYAHAPWHEALFGGASQAALKSRGIPILLTH
jgi:nucleotide-binding universal stress UspA family protein